ncbi:flagellar biosynthesis anti-sigma factor FlgM [Jeongeupia naejangsanensis]|uniref:Negative regulator of flagellin synthesis n=1 Tax=Jeongeupia naejangsanensis TaxID=613195 RepID=A0ABS2BGH2_9NEIS|nr:flagellar biosynthesis anti-sigma factor FlgM [Jeongeupia naejangsanensis]MBM3114708.1 flagellar biosynthesis anti-sigma factor FlgM [Jeongeupia naejangsanensis]
MKITQTGGAQPVAATPAAQGTDTAAKPQSTTVRTAPAGLQSDALKPAQAALAELPDFDADKVAEIKAALADGRIGFDAGKLAALIRRHHGGGA